MRNYFWLRRLSVQTIIGLACLLAFAACTSPNVTQKAIPTVTQSNGTPILPPILSPSATSVAPPATGNTTLVYDDQMGAVLFLGDTHYINNQPEQTWIWDGSAWMHLHPAHEPSNRSNVAIAYDPATKQVVLFGGLSSLGNAKWLSDTWTWDGTDWTQQHPTASPPARDDAATNQLVLFGGGSNKPLIGGLVPPPLNDTWVWTGTNWVQFHPQTSPNLFDMVNGQQVLYSYPNMVYNPQSQQIFLLFGGDSQNDKVQAGWSWDGTNWSQATVNGPPTSADTGDLLYDVKMQAVLEMTDILPSTSISFDTTLWKLEGQTWVKLDEWGLS